MVAVRQGLRTVEFNRFVHGGPSSVEVVVCQRERSG